MKNRKFFLSTSCLCVYIYIWFACWTGLHNGARGRSFSFKGRKYETFAEAGTYNLNVFVFFLWVIMSMAESPQILLDWLVIMDY